MLKIKSNLTHTEIRLKKLDKGLYEVSQNILYRVFGGRILVPKGFLTDLASVPKCIQKFVPVHGDYTPASILHDYLYSSESKYPLNRKESDLVFLEIMKKCNVSRNLRNEMFFAVRVFGSNRYSYFKKSGTIIVEKKAVVDKRKKYLEHIKEVKSLFPNMSKW